MNLARLDPRVKLLVLAALSASALASGRIAALSSLFALSLFILLAGGIGPRAIWEKLYRLVELLITLFILQLIFNRRGDPMLALRGVTLVTRTGFRTAVILNLRLLIIMLGALIVASGEQRDYLLALTWFRLPYEIAFMALIAARFIPMLREEAQDMLCAMQMRGLRIKKAGLRSQVGAYMSIALPVLSGAIRRAEQTSVAMEARGFRAYPRRTAMRSLRMRTADYAYSVAFCVLVAAIFIAAALFQFT